MAILKYILLILIFTLKISASDEGEKKSSLISPEFDMQAWERLSLDEKERNVLWQNKQHPDHCDPIKEYKEAILYFRNNKTEISPSESRAREWSLKISKGCSGAAKRFIKVFLLLKKSGVDQSRAVLYGIEFANTDDDTVESFFELFKKTYLGEYFDLDYSSALKLSFELSKKYKGNRRQAREDFLELSKYCLNKEGLNLPVSYCVDLSVNLTRMSQYYPDGIRNDFFRLYKTLREDRKFGVNILTAIRIIKEVLPYGPLATQTFLKSYEFAIDPSGLGSGGMAAVKFAVNMSKNSVKSWPPPIFTPPKYPLPNKNINNGFTIPSEYKSDNQKRTSEVTPQSEKEK